MKRRQIIKALGAAGVVSVLGYKWYEASQQPVDEYLAKRTEFIAEISETIIPATETPGAKEANVAAFVVYAVKEILDDREKKTFLNGLKKIEAYCVNVYHKEFEQCSGNQRLEVLSSMRSNWPLNNFLKKVKRKLTGREFTDILRELVIVGYCTSELGATQGLAYDFIPGGYDGCMATRAGQKSWATK